LSKPFSGLCPKSCFCRQYCEHQLLGHLVERKPANILLEKGFCHFVPNLRKAGITQNKRSMKCLKFSINKQKLKAGKPVLSLQGQNFQHAQKPFYDFWHSPARFAESGNTAINAAAQPVAEQQASVPAEVSCCRGNFHL